MTFRCSENDIFVDEKLLKPYGPLWVGNHVVSQSCNEIQQPHISPHWGEGAQHSWDAPSWRTCANSVCRGLYLGKSLRWNAARSLKVITSFNLKVILTNGILTIINGIYWYLLLVLKSSNNWWSGGLPGLPSKTMEIGTQPPWSMVKMPGLLPTWSVCSG